MLFRKPVKGDYVREKRTMTTFLVDINWSDDHFKTNKNNYEFVEVTLVEPPPSRYVNIYPDKLPITQHPSRAEADEYAGLTRIACVNLDLLEGWYDE